MARLQKRASSAGVTVYKVKRSKKKKRKGSRGLRGLERAMTQMADAQRSFADSYSARHRRSNRKKKDGWLRDLGENLSKAHKRGRKKIKLRRILRRLY